MKTNPFMKTTQIARFYHYSCKIITKLLNFMYYKCIKSDQLLILSGSISNGLLPY